MTFRTISIVCLGLASVVARGEDDRIAEAPEAASQAAGQQQHLVDLGGNFDANLFEQQGNGWVLRQGGGMVVMGNAIGRVRGRIVVNGREMVMDQDVEPTESPAAARARQVGEKRLARIEEACAITDEQRRTLRLAMESDIRRFAAEIDAVRAKYAGVRINMNDPPGQKRWNEFQQDVQRCRQRLRGLFGVDSLLGSVLSSTLDDAQFGRIETEAKSRRSFRWRSLVSGVLVRVDDALGLTQEQHDVIERELLAREPRLRVDELTQEQENQHLQIQLVYMVLSGCDHKRIKERLSDRQWRALSLNMNQGKAMRSWIEQQGILEPVAP